MQQQKQFKVLLIGDSCSDEYVYGICERLNPEAPVPILRETEVKTQKGMAWNVRENLMSFGIEVYILTQKERIRPEKSEVDRLLSSNKKARKILKWKPKYIGSTGFKKGLEKTIEWFNDKENLSHYNVNIYNV